jgi:hypothetical protein
MRLLSVGASDVPSRTILCTNMERLKTLSQSMYLVVDSSLFFFLDLLVYKYLFVIKTTPVFLMYS